MNNLLDRVKEMSVKSKIISVVAIVVVVGGLFVWHSQSNNQLSGTYKDSDSGYYVAFKGNDKAEFAVGGKEKDATYKINKDNTITFTTGSIVQDKLKFELSDNKKSIKVVWNDDTEREYANLKKS